MAEQVDAGLAAEEEDGLFPGVTEWFSQRRESDRRREEEAIRRIEDAEGGVAVDIPVSGADWPYGRALDVDALHREASARGLGEGDWTVLTTPDPPGTILRVRMRNDTEGRRAVLGFVRETCGHARDEENENRLVSHGHPFAAMCARLASRMTGTRWMSAYALAGMMPLAPPDAVATGMAGYATALALALPECDPAMLPGTRELDVVLEPVFDARTLQGRWALRKLEEVHRDAAPDGRWVLCGPTPPMARLAPESAPRASEEARRWRVGGFESDNDPRRRAIGANQREIAMEADRMAGGTEHPDPPPSPSDASYLCRLGLGITRTLSQLDADASTEQVAGAAAAEHGLTCGHDWRVQRFAVRVATSDRDHGHDLKLALARLAHITGDPCEARRTLGEVERALARAPMG